jgi:L-2-hydroxyglutarate oxidase LhgO
MQATRLPKSVDFLRAVCKQHSNYKQQKTINKPHDKGWSVNFAGAKRELCDKHKGEAQFSQ